MAPGAPETEMLTVPSSAHSSLFYGECSSVVEYLPGMCKALGLIPVTHTDPREVAGEEGGIKGLLCSGALMQEDRWDQSLEGVGDICHEAWQEPPPAGLGPLSGQLHCSQQC